MAASFSSIAHGLAGGVMIGCAAAAMLLFLGRIAGVSGLAAQAFWLSDQGSRLIEHAAFRRKRLNAESVIDCKKAERDLGLVGIQDSHRVLDVIQALDGAIRSH